MFETLADQIDFGDGRALLGLEGRVAVVAGGGSATPGIGNGRAAAILLARAGAHVVLLDVSGAAGTLTQTMIAAEGGSSEVLTVDVSQEDQIRDAIRAVAETHRRVDVLVNNVGIAGPGGNAVDLDSSKWDYAMAVNVTSFMLPSGGSIVNISSGAGIRAGHPALMYPTSKAAVAHMSLAMAAHHGPEGIRVNCVAPGAVYTPMVQTRGMDDDLRELRRVRSLLQTEGYGWDTGMAVLFLASRLSRWITGVVLPVDAGYAAAGMAVATPPRFD
jgi:NAD(P)-dependent dehydrogenase (short-subunit alcohol dehydrogenase family)